MSRKSNIEILAIIKKEGGCKTNQDILNLVEELADIMRKKKSKAVYLTESKHLKINGFKDPAPEIDYIR